MFLRTVFNEQQKHEFGEIVSYFKENAVPLSKDLAFLLGKLYVIDVSNLESPVLGFFVKEVVSRWWRQYLELPNPDTLALQLHALVNFEDKQTEALQFSHSLMRYVILSYVLVVRRVSKVILS